MECSIYSSVRALAESPPILGFWGSKVPQNVRFPAQDTVNQIWRRWLYPRRRNP